MTTETKMQYRVRRADGSSLAGDHPFETREHAQSYLESLLAHHSDPKPDMTIVGEPIPVKRRTITLTDRPPVKIREDQWPQIACGTGDSFTGKDYGRHSQALGQGECDTYALRVRQHADGRAIVYGVFDAATAWTRNEGRRGGELLDSSAYLAAAIRRVGEHCNLPDSIIRECIADLPAEDLT